MNKFQKERPISWSQISNFEYNPEEWYRKNILKEYPEETKEMVFGKEFAKSIEDGTCTVPGLLNILQKKKEHPFKVRFGDINLVGFADAFCDETFKKLDEVKTGKRLWDQKRADEHGQFDMYLLMNYITNKINPEDVTCKLHWIRTEDNSDFSISFVTPLVIHTFETKRTMAQILNFGTRIRRVYKEMEEYVLAKNLNKNATT